MYQNLIQIHLPPRQSQKFLLQIAETLFDVGTDQLQKKSLDGAVKYLRWSWDYISQILRVEGLSVDGRELSVNVRHNLAKALVGRDQALEMDLERARELIEGLTLVGDCVRGVMVGCAEGVLDVSSEDGVFGQKWRECGCNLCQCVLPRLNSNIALDTMIELVDITEETFNKYTPFFT